MLNLLHAKTFLAVLGAGGFRAAARMLDLSPSTILDHIDQLEADLAAPLLVRRRGAVAPTAQGAAFVPLARALLETAEHSRILIANAPLRLAAASNIGTYMLQSVLVSFQAADSCAVELWVGPNREVAARLTQGQADIALMEWWDDRPGFVARVWRREPLVAIVAPGHPWTARPAVGIADLAAEPLLAGEGGTGTMTLLRAQLGDRAAALKALGGLGSTEAVKRAVRAGRGVSLVLAAAVVDEVAAGQLVALPIAGAELMKELVVIAPLDLPAAAPGARFVEHLLRQPLP